VIINEIDIILYYSEVYLYFTLTNSARKIMDNNEKRSIIAKK